MDSATLQIAQPHDSARAGLCSKDCANGHCAGVNERTRRHGAVGRLGYLWDVD
jgi:hypothetical protein